MENLLEVEGLSVSFFTPDGEVQAVRDVSFSVKEGETLALVGESGCGKSVLCKSVMKLLPETGTIKSGHIRVDGTEITDYREREMCGLRGRLFSMAIQDSLTALNPTMSLGRQIGEAVKVHNPRISKGELKGRVEELMNLVGIPCPAERGRMYPGQFSGGMRQRAVLAMALAGNPRLLFADEPTTALDAALQTRILDLLREVQKKRKMALVFVTHDLGAAARIADRVAVMYAGKIVETGRAEEIFYDPRHPYTWGLMQALPGWSGERERLPVIPGAPPSLLHPPKGDAFAWRNPYALAIDYEEEPPLFSVSETHFAATWLLDPRAPKIRPPVRIGSGGDASDGMGKLKGQGRQGEELPPMDGKPLLEVRDLTHSFPLTRKTAVKGVDGVSFQVGRGEIFGLVGESGSGKSTIARCVMSLYCPQGGSVFYQGIDVRDPKAFRANRRLLQTSRQMIFQDSASSLSRRMKVWEIIGEPLRLGRIPPKNGTLRAEAAALLKDVGLEESCLDKYPGQLSGGERQRVAIARALSVEPQLLVADEPIASLDASMQAQIVNLFQRLQREQGFSLLFIAHDLAMVRFLCHRVGVMCRGRLVELAAARELFQNPLHPYTQALVSAIPIPDPKRERTRTPVEFQGEGLDGDGALAEAEPGHFVWKRRSGS